jgi:hypothetical protein
MLHSKLSILIFLLQLLPTIMAIGAALTSAQKSEIISLHSKLRKAHSNTSGLHWSSLLALESQAFVTNCQYNDNSKALSLLKESLAVDNVAQGYEDWQQTINAWYSGNKYYDYNNPGYTDDAGTFISMVWKDSTEIGCAAINCSNLNGFLYQCLYSPSIPLSLILDAKEYQLNVLPST